MWEASTAGVASWISDVVMLPVFSPRRFASSSRVAWGLPSMSTEIAPLEVLVPVAHPLPLAAESVT